MVDVNLLPSNDDLVVGRIKNGEIGLFESLMQRHESRVYGFFLRMTRDPQDAQELAQDCFLKAFSALKNYDPRGKFKSWLMAIAGNLLKNHFSKVNRRKAMVQTSVEVESLGEIAEKQSVADDEMTSMLSWLPSEYRTVLVLKYVSDLNCSEIAAAEGISESLVKQRLFRGREMIRLRIEEDEKNVSISEKKCHPAN